VVLGSFLFMHRMAQIVAVEHGTPEGGAMLGADMADNAQPRVPYRGKPRGDTANELVLRISGPLFFGAAATTGAVLERIGRFPALVILDLSAVPFLDSTAAQSLRAFADKAARNGALFAIIGATPGVRRVLITEGLREPGVHYAADLAQARLDAAGG
jgi:SulP family sulfate permease